MKTLSELLAISTISNMSAQDALAHIAMLIDVAWDNGAVEGIKLALRFCDELLHGEQNRSNFGTLNYFKANAWAALRQASDPNRDRSWDWQQDEAEQEIIFLRKALASDGLSENVKIQALTNLAGRMNEFGRPIEAIEYWDSALRISPRFGMALANKAIGLRSFAFQLYDEGHRYVYLNSAYLFLQKGLKSKSIDPSARIYFEKYVSELDRYSELSCIYEDADKFSLGDTPTEQKYRVWCLKERLFLNPLNDLLEKSISAIDIFGMPSMILRLNEPPVFFGYFNQLKQEYVSSRFLYYYARDDRNHHYSDREVLLTNTLDYPIYGLRGELLKVSFRTCYSLFDKIAFFIRNYFKLDIPEHKVNFRSVWYLRGEVTKGLNPILTSCKNNALRGLFWLAKDLFSEDENFRIALEPDAQELKVIRNHLEHKYFKLHSDFHSLESYSEVDSIRNDTLAFSMHESELKKKTLKLIKMGRAGLTYLSLAVYEEERRRESEDSGKIVAKMPVATFDDDWKR